MCLLSFFGQGNTCCCFGTQWCGHGAAGQIPTRSRKMLVASGDSGLFDMIVRAPFRWPSTMFDRPFWTSWSARKSHIGQPYAQALSTHRRIKKNSSMDDIWSHHRVIESSCSMACSMAWGGGFGFGRHPKSRRARVGASAELTTS